MLVGLLAILAAAAPHPTAAESDGVTGSFPALGAEESTPAAPSSGKHVVTDHGSGVLASRPADDVDADLAVDFADGDDVDGLDPIADAFADSSRAGGLVVETRPPYPIELNDEVQKFVDRFTGRHRAIVALWVSRSRPYLGMIREVLRERGLPEELAYTAMIESGFNPTAVSRAGAKGMWQFMPGTARRYGLRVDKWVDERLDPEKATVAAAAYLRDLFNLFGSWPLAQAAYNAGELKIARAIRATGSTDFWMLARTRLLKNETKEFVPRIHAAAIIGSDPARFGFEFEEGELPEYETVTVPASTHLHRVATASRIPLPTLQQLNRVLVRAVTPPGGSYVLRVPSGSTDLVAAAVAPKPSRRIVVAARQAPERVTRTAATSSVHVVRVRDTVSSIAKRYGVSVGDVLKWNSLDHQDPIRPGDRLRIADGR